MRQQHVGGGQQCVKGDAIERGQLCECLGPDFAPAGLVVAQAVLCLIANDFITGACLNVDGGRLVYAGADTLR